MVTADPALDIWIDSSNWSGAFALNVATRGFKTSVRPVDMYPYPRHRPMSAGRPAALLHAPNAADFGDILASDGGPSAYACMRHTHGVKGGIIGTQDAAITKAQMTAVHGGGGGLMAYVYLYFAGDPVAQVNTALDRCAGFPVQVLILDCEDPFAENLTERATLDFIHAAAKACDNRIRSAIYTAPYWWKRQTKNSTEFSTFPLHHASADSNGDLDPVDYGGWKGRPYIEQYAFDQNLCGVNVDLNVMAPPVAPQPPVITRPRLEYVSTQERWDDQSGLYIVESTYREAGA